MADQPKDPNQEEIIGKLCILEYEMPVTESLLLKLGRTGSDALDSLFDFSIPYSSTLLSSIPAFYQKEVDFPIVADQVLGAIYKHPKQWKHLSQLVRSESDPVTVYICPVTGVPKIIPSSEIYQIQVNGLTVKMMGTGLSKLSRVTHQDVSFEDAEKAREYLQEIGFVGAMIEDMNEFVHNLLLFITASKDEVFVDFFQDLILQGDVSININAETGDIEVLHTDSDGEPEWSDADEETLQELLEQADDEEDKGIEQASDEDYIHTADSMADAGAFEEFGFSRQDLKDESSVFVKGNDTKH